MQVVGDEFGTDIEDGQQMRHRLFEKTDRRGVVEAPDMLRQPGLPPLHHADRVLQVAAKRQYGRPSVGQRDGHRYVAAGAADEAGAHFYQPAVRRRPGISGRAYDAVVTANDDVAVMQQEGVRDPGEAFTGLVVADDQRFPVRVGAGHHQQQRAGLIQPVGPGRPPGGLVPEQQVQRRRRQHDAQRCQTGCDAGQFALALGTEHDRRGNVA